MALIELKGAGKSLLGPDRIPNRIITSPDFEADSGNTYAILGRSGSGKSTLLSMLGLLEPLDEGAYHFNGADVSSLSDAELSRLRGTSIGFVYQRFFLLGHLSAAQNVRAALLHAGVPRRRHRDLVRDALAQVGLSGKAEHRPAQLSGGEQQRVAIARAVVNGPRLILADEPTGALDEQTAHDVLGLLTSLVRDRGACLVSVTHDPVVAAELGQTRRLRAGRWEEL